MHLEVEVDAFDINTINADRFECPAVSRVAFSVLCV
jgi:hypothetical protein